MKLDQRGFVAAASVGAIALAVSIALWVGPGEARLWLSVPGFVAIAMSISSVAANPRELTVALICGAAPVMGLLAEGAPDWMIGPLGVLLLIGGELNAWSWDLGRTQRRTLAIGGRPSAIARLTGVALVASVGVAAVARWDLLRGPAAALVAAAALAMLAWIAIPAGAQIRDGR